MQKLKRDLILLALIAILVNWLIWLPFLLGWGEGMKTVFKNYDGPYYLAIAKSWYRPALIANNFSLPTPLEYYPAHLPGYPLTISLLDPLFIGPWAMLLATTAGVVGATWSFYLLIHKFQLSTNPFFLSLLFLVLPARWVAVKAVGSPEPLFLGAILASFYFFKSAFDRVDHNLWSRKKLIWLDLLLAGVFGAIAQITKSPGILLFFSYVLYLLVGASSNLRKFFTRLLPLCLIPLAALAVFFFYQLKTGDFFAYFHSGDNFHLAFPPFQAFTQNRSWLGDFWREDMIWQYLLGALAVIFLVKKKYYDLACFAGVFFTATLFVAHRDLARYSLPLLPFALIAFDSYLQKKEFKIALLIILPAIYLYTLNFILGNTAPLADWTPYL